MELKINNCIKTCNLINNDYLCITLKQINMNIELESIEVNERTIEVSGFIYATNEDWANGNVTYFDWCLDIIREYNIDEHCEGWNVEFDERKMVVNDKHLFDILTKQDYNKVVDEIDYHLANN